uniref:Uncharacterized protein n=1 Tax=Cacopsylla melanoneura TaxID=428564 RepID=A0A8D8XHM6_9HEMI
MFQVLVYTVYLLLKSTFIVAHFNQILSLQDHIMVSFYDVRYALLILFLLPYTVDELKYELFLILTEQDFTTRLQTRWTQKSHPRLSLLRKFVFWWMVEMVVYHFTPGYSLKVIAYAVYSLEALLEVLIY